MAADRRWLPAGTVTFLFTDIEASTRLMSELGTAFETWLDIHDAVLRDAWDTHDGVEVNTEGDAFFVAFESADAAVAAAADGQRRLAAADWPDGRSLPVRMGLHRGFARPRRGDYVAIAVNRAARVVATAHGGQIVLTGEVVDGLVEPVELLDRGRFAVRDFDDPPTLFTVVPDGWAGSDRALRARPVDGQNLLRPLTELIDRTDDLAHLDTTVAPGRVVTVVGPGGVGKTRLAVEHGLAALDRWPDGVWLADLESARSVDQVANAVAAAIGAPQQAGAPATEDVRRHLEGQRVLLILDNCEQARDAVASLIGHVLPTSPGSATLATSRAPLGLRGEIVHRLSTLPVGGDESPAVALFRSRAGHVADHEASAVERLCHRLDGLPLAIELAAVRAASVPPSMLVEWIDRAPDMLSTNDPTLPERQRSLDRVLQWSHDLLDESSQTLFRRLAVFTDGFKLDTAFRACEGRGLDDRAIPGAFWSLIDHSLVVPDTSVGGSRYRMLGPVRAWASNQVGTDDGRRTVESLASLYLARLGPEQATHLQWVSEIFEEMDNVRGVIRSIAASDEENAQALAWSVARAHEVVGAYDTATNELREVVAELSLPHPNRVGLLAKLADILLRMGRVDEAEDVLGEASDLENEVGCPAWDEVAVSRPRGEVALRRSDHQRARQIGMDLLSIAHRPASTARAWNLIGIASATAGDLEAAVHAFENEVRACLDGGVETFLVGAHGNLADAYLRSGDVAGCAREQLNSLHLAREGGSSESICFSAMVAAELSLEDAPEVAVPLHAAATRILSDSSHVLHAADSGVAATFETTASQLLSPQQYSAAREEGAAFSLEQIADLAHRLLASHQTRED